MSTLPSECKEFETDFGYMLAPLETRPILGSKIKTKTRYKQKQKKLTVHLVLD